MPKGDTILHWITVLKDAEWDREESLDQLLHTESPVEKHAANHALAHWLIASLPILLLLASSAPFFVPSRQEPAPSHTHRVVSAQKSAQQQDVQSRDTILALNESGPNAMHSDPAQTSAPQSSHAPRSHPIAQDTRVAYLRPATPSTESSFADPYLAAYRRTQSSSSAIRQVTHVAPSDVFWGQTHVLHTQYFCIQHRQADAKTVKEVSLQLDAIYDSMRSDISLDNDATSLVVKVMPAQASTISYLRFHHRHLEAPSPLLLSLPDGATQTEALVQAIVHPLVMHVWLEPLLVESLFVCRSGTEMRWAPMIHGIQLWQAHAHTAFAQNGYDDALHWLLHTAPEIQSGHRTPTEKDLKAVCQMGNVWHYKISASVAPQALCLDPEWRQSMLKLTPFPSDLNLLLSYNESSPSVKGASTWHSHWVRRITASSVIDYYINAYGRERLPALIAAFSTHDDWDTLTQELLGIPSADFESGWRQHLAEQYADAP